MILPPLQGSFNQQRFFIFVACDTRYFDEFAINLVNSIRRNTDAGVHLHIFNPRQDQLNYFCNDNKISITYEMVNLEDFIRATANLEKKSSNLTEQYKLNRSQTAAKKGNDLCLIERVMKTYFACARFVRLAEIVKTPRPFFAIDIDAIVRSQIHQPNGDFDFYVHYVSGKDPRFLAGGIYFSGKDRSLDFLNEYSNALKTEIENDQLYWSLDQEVLKIVIPKYNHGQLPFSYIDWNMNPESAVWTAKGTRKDLEIFIFEKTKYNS